MATDTGEEVASSAQSSGAIASNKALEQFLILAKNVKGLAAVEMVKQVLTHPHIYVFAELLEMPNIKELQLNPETESYYRLLCLFAYGKCSDYNLQTMPPLTDAMKNKLRHLTIVSLATQSKVIPYKVLLSELGITNLRELEDLIIEVIYLNIIKGKMDQENGWIEINSTISRDIRAEDLDSIVNVLSNWCSNCDNVLANIELQIRQANAIKNDHIKNKQDLENQINNIKKSLKTSTQEMEDIDTCNSGTPPPGQRDVMSHLEKIKRNVARSGKGGSGTRQSNMGTKAFWQK
ncbi:COP9 signalosome complex subunit 7a-like protein [Dinothrombium tinctorium]|uniref:COP9 signalosome complex subunit 7a-like protein n=1 Tax=Dinothrombium tinctorium TaxID=1965070 RepID=A0A443R9Q1_9ACAR|nr:COP9 signalosome complex subunit 7a-like protein [Dinothrombium tinctorium]